MNKFKIIIPAVLILMAGCATNKVTVDKYSGFLNNYSKLEQSEVYPETKLYITPKVNFSSYKSVVIDRVKILFPDGLERPNNPLLGAVAKAYEEELKASFRAKGYNVTTKVKPGVARIQAAITSVYSSYDDFKAYQYIPISAAITGAMRVSGASKKNARVMMEAKVTDAKTGKLLASVVDLQKGKELKSSSSEITVNEVKPILKQWATRFANALARLQKN